MTRYYKVPSDPSSYRPDDPNSYTYVDGYGFTPPPPILTERRLLQRYSNGLGFSILLYFILTAFVPFLILWGCAVFRPAIRIYGNQVLASSSIIQLVNLLSSVICLFLPFFLFVLLSHVPLRIAFPLRRFSSSLCVPCVFVSLAVSVVGVVSSSLLGNLLSLFSLTPHTSLYLPEETGARVLFGLQLCLIAPLVEEFVFRGMIFQSMRRFGDSFALILSAILFAMFHGNLVQAPNAFLMGLVIGYFVLYSGSLWVGVIIHMVNNILSFAMDLIGTILPAEYQPVFTLCIFAFYLISGLAALLLLVRKYPNMFMFIRSTTLSTERIKYRVAFSSVTMVFALILLSAIIIQNMIA